MADNVTEKCIRVIDTGTFLHGRICRAEVGDLDLPFFKGTMYGARIKLDGGFVTLNTSNFEVLDDCICDKQEKENRI